ncbi:paraneoplastic antigen Ma3 homolog [Pecten maximus]|uniref:paraneoplastic antigen Ma3 homolog n=1 Tax=Pecten maximus TaxID=6579 RepID=UPI0014581ACE|nr:paraneoplastic antigen Ma3 homolog [Pecten maximus]
MDSVFGNVQQAEMLLAQFYSAKQHADEDVASWSCRLEDLVAKAVESGQVTKHKPALKDASGYMHENINDFDELRIALRRLEDDWNSRQPEKVAKKEATITKVATTVMEPGKSEMSELKGIIQQLAAEVKDLRVERQGSQSQHKQTRVNASQGREQQRYRGGRENQFNQQPQQFSDDGNDQQGAAAFEEPTCYRCGQKGHIKLGCRAKLQRPSALNDQRPASRGRR